MIKCEKSRFGALNPTYAHIVDLYFDKKAGDDYAQKFPLPYYSLKNLYTDQERQELFSYHSRSFFYSINSSKQYEQVFDKLSEEVRYPSAVANFIARLNAILPKVTGRNAKSFPRLI